ncbi:unnamed protein product [Amoebophrya sp. A25]|nr:unnamed protein product [Amoebophrya sp. A25]|eukprot:GSA25T00010403001.1
MCVVLWVLLACDRGIMRTAKQAADRTKPSTAAASLGAHSGSAGICWMCSAAVGCRFSPGLEDRLTLPLVSQVREFFRRFILQDLPVISRMLTEIGCLQCVSQHLRPALLLAHF